MKACTSAALAGCFAAIVAQASMAAQALSETELMQMLASVEASSARFTETRTSALLKAPLVLQGTLAYRRPDRIEKHVLSPYEERVSIEGARLTLEKPGEKGRRTISISQAPGVAALVESIRATRAGDLAGLKRYYALEVEGSREKWTLRLRPLAEPVASLVRSIEISGAEARVARVAVEEASGDRSVMELSEQGR